MSKIRTDLLAKAMKGAPSSSAMGSDDKLARLERAELDEMRAEASISTVALRVVPNATVPDAPVEVSDSREREVLPVYQAGMPVVPGKQYLVPLEFLKDNKNNSRAIYVEASVQSVAESLRNHGQLQAALGYAPTPDEPFFTLKEGHTRTRALKRLPGKQLLRLEVVERPDNALSDYQQSRDINLKRKDLTVFDDAVRFKELMAEHDLKQEELANAVGVTVAYVSKTLKIGRLPNLLLERMAECTDPAFGTALAYAVAQVFELRGEAGAEKFVSKIIETKPSVRQVEAMLRQLHADPDQGEAVGEVAKNRRLRPLSRAEIRGAARGELKLFPDGRIQAELLEMDTALTQKLYSAMIRSCAELGLEVSGIQPDVDN